MRNINYLDDFGAPVAVAVVDIVAQRSARVLAGQTMQQWSNYAMTVGGYGAAMMGWGGKYNGFLKNVGIASAPGTLVALYNMIAKPTTPASISRMSRPVNMRVSRYPGAAPEAPFQGIRLV